jgi:hypothetical protein
MSTTTSNPTANPQWALHHLPPFEARRLEEQLEILRDLSSEFPLEHRRATVQKITSSPQPFPRGMPLSQETCEVVLSTSLDLCASDQVEFSIKDLTGVWDTLLISHGFRPSLWTLSVALGKLQGVQGSLAFVSQLTDRLWTCGVFDLAIAEREEATLSRILSLCGRETLPFLLSLEARLVSSSDLLKESSSLRLGIIQGLLQAGAFDEVSVRIRTWIGPSTPLKELHELLELLQSTCPSSEFALSELLPLCQRWRRKRLSGTVEKEEDWTERTYVRWIECAVKVGNSEVAHGLWQEAMEKGLAGKDLSRAMAPFIPSNE